MTVIREAPTGTVDSQIASGWNTGYLTPGTLFHYGRICGVEDVSETKSVASVRPLEPELNPYRCMRSSGGLAFWDQPQEDVYSFDDGQPT